MKSSLVGAVSACRACTYVSVHDLKEVRSGGRPLNGRKRLYDIHLSVSPSELPPGALLLRSIAERFQRGRSPRGNLLMISSIAGQRQFTRHPDHPDGGDPSQLTTMIIRVPATCREVAEQSSAATGDGERHWPRQSPWLRPRRRWRAGNHPRALSSESIQDEAYQRPRRPACAAR